MIEQEEIREGLLKVRDLVDETHWIQGNYMDVYYPRDGDYTDGTMVREGKVVGCLVGLTRLVAHEHPLTVQQRDEDIPKATDLSLQMETAMRETIREEFVDEEFYSENEDGELEPIEDVSVEGWNDVASRTREQVLAMLDRAIERASVSV